VIMTLVVAGAAAFGAAQALATSEPITTSPTCCAYSKTQFTIDSGTVATFQNNDPSVTQHDVTSVAQAANGQPLFRSATIGAGQAPVNGTQSLAPGTYQFFCSVHPTEMVGQLVVTGSPPTTTKKKCKKAKKGASSAKKKCKKKGKK